jgi:dTDP-4-amino-4,6-dideoxygalactose transaminase
MVKLVDPIIGEKEKKAVDEVLSTKQLACGKYTADFEEAFRKYNGAKYAVGVNNGTTALHTALLSVGIKPGDKVITTAFSFIATANSILYCQAVPVFADISADHYNVTADSLERALSQNKDAKAILIVHLYGQPCNMDEIMALKKKYNVSLVEDCAQAHGAQYKGKNVGTFGDAGTFSFYGTKNMTTGEGGMVLLSDEKNYNYAKQVINHGRSNASTFTILGYNYRMTNISAAIGLAQLESLECWTKKRISNAQKLIEGLKDVSGIKLPRPCPDTRHVYHQFTISIDGQRRDKMMAHLKDNGVECGIYYDRVMYAQPYYQETLGFKMGLCPVAEAAAKDVLSIPVHPGLSDLDIDKIIETVKSFRG